MSILCWGAIKLRHMSQRYRFPETIVPRVRNTSDTVDVVYSVYWRPGLKHMKEEELVNFAFYVIAGVNPNHTDIFHHFYFVYDASQMSLQEATIQIEALLAEEPFHSRLYKRPNVFIHILPNDGRDFCNFSRSLVGQQSRVRSGYVLFMNTSVRGPFVNLAVLNALDGRWTDIFLAMFDKAEDMRAVALMWDCTNGVHFYSFTFMLDAQGVELARDKWSEACQMRDISDNVILYEVGFSHEIIDHGGRFGVLIEEDYMQTLQKCKTAQPYQNGNFTRFEDTIYPFEQLFFKAAGTSAYMDRRPKHVLKRLQMHSVWTTDFALRQFPLQGPVTAINLTFPDPIEWSIPSFRL